MRVVITEAPGLTPVVLDRLKAVILAADDGANDSAVPCIAHGDPQRLAELAAVILTSIRVKLGERAFAAVVQAAKAPTGRIQDVTNQARPAPNGDRK
jgi:hypothetical protein